MLQPVLIELTYNETKLFTSATALDERYILTTSHILFEEIKKLRSRKSLNRNNDLRSIDEIIERSFDFNVIFASSGKEFLYKRANLYAFFNCNEIYESRAKYLQNWKAGNGTDDLDLLGLFFILKVINDDNKTSNSKLGGDGKRCFNENEHRSVQEGVFSYNNYSDLLGLMERIYNNAGGILNCKIGEHVLIRSTPFGERILLNSHVEGVISNVFGDNNCLILSDCPTTMGSEGGLLYFKGNQNRTLLPVGLVLSSLNWWNGEWLGLTLCVSFTALFAQFFERKAINDQNDQVRYLNDDIKYGLVQIICGPNWGTGILVNKHKGIFLTSSHVIDSGCAVRLLWNRSTFEAEILYQPDVDSMFDIAVLKCKDGILPRFLKTSMKEIHFSSKYPKQGDQVVAAGFPIFSADLNTSPSVTAGNISQCNDGRIITSCSVFPGSSGGALLDRNGLLIGIILSNLKSQKTKAVFPRISLVVPVLRLKSILDNYFQGTLDKERFNASLDLIKKELDFNYQNSKL